MEVPLDGVERGGLTTLMWKAASMLAVVPTALSPTLEEAITLFKPRRTAEPNPPNCHGIPGLIVPSPFP